MMDKESNYKFLQALMKRLVLSDPMTIFYDFQYGPQAGTLPEELTCLIDTLENLLLMRVEQGESFEEVEREMGMAAIVMLALHDVQTEPETCPDLTYEQDVLVRGLIDGVHYEGLD